MHATHIIWMYIVSRPLNWWMAVIILKFCKKLSYNQHFLSSEIHYLISEIVQKLLIQIQIPKKCMKHIPNTLNKFFQLSRKKIIQHKSYFGTMFFFYFFFCYIYIFSLFYSFIFLFKSIYTAPFYSPILFLTIRIHPPQ